MFYEWSLGFGGAVMMSCYAVFRPAPPRDGVIAVALSTLVNLLMHIMVYFTTSQIPEYKIFKPGKSCFIFFYTDV